MDTSRSQQLEERLRALLNSTPELEGAAVVSVDGLGIASVLNPKIEEDRIAAMSAAMLSLGERIADELGRGSLEQVYVKGEYGFALLTSVGPQAVLSVIARGDSRLGLVLLELRKVVRDIESLL